MSENIKIGFAFVDVKTSWDKFTTKQKEQIVESADFIDYNFSFGNESDLVSHVKAQNKELRGHAWFGITNKNGESITDDVYVSKQISLCSNWCNQYNLSEWGCNAESSLWRGKKKITGNYSVNPLAIEQLRKFSQGLKSKTITKSAYLGYVNPNYYYPKDLNGKITRELVESFDSVSPMVYQSGISTLKGKMQQCEEIWAGLKQNCFIGPGRISDGKVIGDYSFWKNVALGKYKFPVKDITVYIGNETKNNTKLDDPYWMIFNGHSRHGSWIDFIKEVKESRATEGMTKNVSLLFPKEISNGNVPDFASIINSLKNLSSYFKKS